VMPHRALAKLRVIVANTPQPVDLAPPHECLDLTNSGPTTSRPRHSLSATSTSPRPGPGHFRRARRRTSPLPPSMHDPVTMSLNRHNPGACHENSSRQSQSLNELRCGDREEETSSRYRSTTRYFPSHVATSVAAAGRRATDRAMSTPPQTLVSASLAMQVIAPRKSESGEATTTNQARIVLLDRYTYVSP
jgi:hypothetical protein